MTVIPEEGSLPPLPATPYRSVNQLIDKLYATALDDPASHVHGDRRGGSNAEEPHHRMPVESLGYDSRFGVYPLLLISPGYLIAADAIAELIDRRLVPYHLAPL